MKKALFLTISLMISVVSFAQQQLATLNHNDSITVYYGIDALFSAHNAAVSGDIITLSSGVFNAIEITKVVTIRGAGAWVDTLGNMTIVLNTFGFRCTADSIHHLTIEGIYFLNDVFANGRLYNPQFHKCYFDQNFYCRSENDGIMRNAMFVNCYLKKWFASYNYNNNGRGAYNTYFLNSTIEESWRYDCPDQFANCILKQDPNIGNMVKRLFINSILFYDYGYSSCPTNNSSTAFNCLFIQRRSDCCGDLFSGQVNHILWNKRGWLTVFKDGSYFELNDSIAATCLGDDGTQVGIYGGAVPFNSRVTNPVIKSINVGQRSTADGKLAVDIEVVSEDE